MQIGHHAPGLLIDNHRSFGHFVNEIFPTFARHIPPAAVLAIARGKFAVKAKIHQRAQILIRLEENIPAVSAVSAIRAAPRRRISPAGS